MLMHIVAVTKLVLVPQGMILLLKEFYHPENKTYVLKDKGKNSFRISHYSLEISTINPSLFQHLRSIYFIFSLRYDNNTKSDDIDQQRKINKITNYIASKDLH